MTIPDNCKGIVIFAHGSGSGRHSSRNQSVAKVINQSANIATLLLDLLTEEEDKVDNFTREYRFNIQLLSNRLQSTIDFIKENEKTKDFEVGLFGASTGAAAALIAAHNRKDVVKAIVSRGGRVDLALKFCKVEDIMTPSLFLVGDRDLEVLELNKKVFEKLNNVEKDKKKITVIPGASHLFEEPGKLEQVARLASRWFEKYLINS